jgi:ribonuclease Z
MAPSNMFAFLEEYSALDPGVAGSYVPLDCRDLDRKAHNPLGDKLFQDLGITRVVSVPVAHCPHSYAIIIDGTPFGRVAYSGDCRPSMTFADAAVGTDLLIHESTFEDGMEDEAVLKRHCTVGEALLVGERMRAKAVVLTHFSQRYPRIPPLRGEGNGANERSNLDAAQQAEHCRSIVFAFDFLKLTPGTVSVASALTPALRLLYPCDKESGDEQAEEEGQASLTASKALSVPGLFAQKDLL